MKNRLFTLFALATAVLVAYGLYQALVLAPTEKTMGDIQRIFYIHVPSAWVAFVCFFVNFIASIVYLVWRKNTADAWGVASAEVGVLFCTIVLVTGPMWARYAWGIWWTWDVRLTSTLVLWLIYVSYLLLRRFAAGGQTAVLAAVLSVFGFVDVPLVYLSIRFFRTQHPQPVIAGRPGSGLAHPMLVAFLWNLLAMTCYGALLLIVRYRLERLARAVEARHAELALTELETSEVAR
jgi:heme exporter protein C